MSARGEGGRRAGGRSRTLRLVMQAAAVAMPLACEAAGESLTVVSWGGPYEHSQTKAYFEPFSARTGTRIDVARYNGGLTELRALARDGNVTWDVVDMTMADNKAACRQGLLEPIDHAILLPGPGDTEAREDFIDGALTECGVTHIVYSTVIAYDRRAFPGEKPTAMTDLFDLERFPGMRALQRGPEANLEWALMSYGVPGEDVYQLLSTERGLRLAFERLDSIRDHVIWWTDVARPAALLETGEAAIASGYNGRLFDAAVVRGLPIDIVWDAQIYELDTWAIPRGSAHVAQALAFIRFATGTRPLAEQARYIAYGPARRSSMKLVSTHAATGVDMRPHMPTSPSNFATAVRKDTDWYASLYDHIRERFETWLREGSTR